MNQSLSMPVKLLLLGAGLLSIVTGPVLFLLPNQTSVYFAWTIKNPLTPVFMGACYTSAGIVVLLALKSDRWSVARMVMPSVMIFAVTMLIAVPLHLNIFNWSHPIAWAWFAVYLIAAPVSIALFLITERSHRPREMTGPRVAPMAVPVMALFAALLAIVGLALYLIPQQIASIWPWPLTPLTARVIGGWILAVSTSPWMLARHPRLNVAWITLLANCLLAALWLIGAVWQNSDMTGPPVSVALYLAAIAAFGSFSATTWWRATRGQARRVPVSR
ncbi:MAG: hypothetical protein HY782_17330 [Chloroflexi bacterium]|nr:hypothetical protein [Chloroflexota bacterium]